MDLTRLYNLTTTELREEAERLGVGDTYAMSRGQLIHAIRAREGASRPEGLLGKVFGFAKWAIQAAGETAAARAETGAAAEAATETGAEAETGTETETETETETGAGAEAATGSASGSASGSPAESVSATALVSAPASASGVESINAAATALGSETPVVDPLEPGSTPDDGPPGRAPAGVFSNDRTLFEEPFPTRTMARILAEQGHFKRALAIYARLLDEQPADAELVAEASAVRAEARTRRSHAPP